MVPRKPKRVPAPAPAPEATQEDESPRGSVAAKSANARKAAPKKRPRTVPKAAERTAAARAERKKFGKPRRS